VTSVSRSQGCEVTQAPGWPVTRAELSCDDGAGQFLIEQQAAAAALAHPRCQRIRVSVQVVTTQKQSRRRQWTRSPLRREAGR